MRECTFSDGDVVVRSYRDTDRADLPRLGNNPAVSEYLSMVFPHPYTDANAAEWLEVTSRQDPVMDFAIEYRGALAGGVGLKPMILDYSGTVELGYWLGQEYWGKGIASRAVRLIVPYALDELLYIRIHALVHSPNVASCRVLEKNGFEREGLLRKLVRKNGIIRDAFIYSRLRNP
ncbi:MAG: GNAT family N-acetyltransferase [Planctomycetes bacterium]|nr:GNAT family N-acetyltransferase [Planctomycetota bacterium]